MTEDQRHRIAALLGKLDNLIHSHYSIGAKVDPTLSNAREKLEVSLTRQSKWICQDSINKAPQSDSEATHQDLSPEDMFLKGYELLQSGSADKLAISYILRAAERGNSSAQCNAGLMYLTGRGVEKDEIAGLDWLRKAAELGNSTAMYNLAMMFDNGIVVKQSKEAASFWYNKIPQN